MLLLTGAAAAAVSENCSAHPEIPVTMPPLVDAMIHMRWAELDDEGDRLMANLAAERAKLEAIKQRKLDELAMSGIPNKYRAELAKKKIAA